MTIEFWKATGIRALRTICQTAVATIGTAAVIADVDWRMVVSASLLAGILSVLTSIATGLPEVELAKEAPQTEYEDEEFYDGEEEYILVKDDEEEGK